MNLMSSVAQNYKFVIKNQEFEFTYNSSYDDFETLTKKHFPRLLDYQFRNPQYKNMLIPINKYTWSGIRAAAAYNTHLGSNELVYLDLDTKLEHEQYKIYITFVIDKNNKIEKYLEVDKNINYKHFLKAIKKSLEYKNNDIQLFMTKDNVICNEILDDKTLECAKTIATLTGEIHLNVVKNINEILEV